MLRMFTGALLSLFPFIATLRGVVCEQAFESHLEGLAKPRL
jgi:hypothetical protein